MLYYYNKQMVDLSPRNVVIILAVAAIVLYLWNMRETMQEVIYDAPMGEPDMYDVENPDGYGTTASSRARWENLSVRPEYGSYGSYKGGYDASPGDTHVCKCGYLSKREVDAIGGSHHQLTHLCRKCPEGQSEPAQLGSWWVNWSADRKGCADPGSVGLWVRPECSDCGN